MKENCWCLRHAWFITQSCSSWFNEIFSKQHFEIKPSSSVAFRLWDMLICNILIDFMFLIRFWKTRRAVFYFFSSSYLVLCGCCKVFLSSYDVYYLCSVLWSCGCLNCFICDAVNDPMQYDAYSGPQDEHPEPETPPVFGPDVGLMWWWSECSLLHVGTSLAVLLTSASSRAPLPTLPAVCCGLVHLSGFSGSPLSLWL